MPQYLKIKRSALTAACISLCAVLRLLLSALPEADAAYSPLHLPVLLCAYACGAPSGLVCALLGPLISYAVCALPSPALLPAVAADCAVCALVMGLVPGRLRVPGRKGVFFAGLLAALLLGRLAGGAANALVYARTFPAAFSIAALWLLRGMPGMLLLLVLLPLVLSALENASLLPIEPQPRELTPAAPEITPAPEETTPAPQETGLDTSGEKTDAST